MLPLILFHCNKKCFCFSLNVSLFLSLLTCSSRPLTYRTTAKLFPDARTPLQLYANCMSALSNFRCRLELVVCAVFLLLVLACTPGVCDWHRTSVVLCIWAQQLEKQMAVFRLAVVCRVWNAVFLLQLVTLTSKHWSLRLGNHGAGGKVGQLRIVESWSQNLKYGLHKFKCCSTRTRSRFSIKFAL